MRDGLEIHTKLEVHKLCCSSHAIRVCRHCSSAVFDLFLFHAHFLFLNFVCVALRLGDVAVPLARYHFSVRTLYFCDERERALSKLETVGVFHTCLQIVC